MKSKIQVSLSYTIIVILTLYCIGHEHSLYEVYTDLMLSTISVSKAFDSLVLLSIFSVFILFLITILIIFLIRKESFNWFLGGTFLVHLYIYGKIILDHHRLKINPNDGFTYQLIFEKYGQLIDIILFIPLLSTLISIVIVLAFISQKVKL